MSTIVSVIPNNDHTLIIKLNNQHIIIYDMKPRLESVRFCHLADLDSFKAVRIEHGNTLVWGNLCELTLDEIINTIER